MQVVGGPLRCLTFLLCATSVSTSVYPVYRFRDSALCRKKSVCVWVSDGQCQFVCVFVCGPLCVHVKQRQVHILLDAYPIWTVHKLVPCQMMLVHAATWSRLARVGCLPAQATVETTPCMTSVIQAWASIRAD